MRFLYLQSNISRWMHSIVRARIALRCNHCMLLWQQSATNDCNQDRQHTLANRCSLSSAVSSSVLCCHSHSLLLQILSCPTVSAQVIGVLSMMHTTARADHKELSAKKVLCRSRLESWHGNYRMGIVLYLCQEALLWWTPWNLLATTMTSQEHFTPYCCFRQPPWNVP